MRLKSTLLVTTLLAGLLGFVYFGWLTIQAAWLGATPNFPAEVAEEAALRVGVLAIVSLLIAGLSLFWIFKKK